MSWFPPVEGSVKYDAIAISADCCAMIISTYLHLSFHLSPPFGWSHRSGLQPVCHLPAFLFIELVYRPTMPSADFSHEIGTGYPILS